MGTDYGSETLQLAGEEARWIVVETRNLGGGRERLPAGMIRATNISRPKRESRMPRLRLKKKRMSACVPAGDWSIFRT
jgi:hypothetical protein